MTLFDEMIRVKQVALLRGDVIAGMTQDEGGALMDIILDSYLVDSEYDIVTKFNRDPHNFDHE